jgi:hypothetical protein
MGDIMTQVGREVWSMNMVSTLQCNRSRVDTAKTTKKMKPGTYDLVMWQHNNKPLILAAWGDNSVVITLSNCHWPEVLAAGDGMNRKRRDNNGMRERMWTEVPCPAQMKYYCQTFHLIDKGNGAEKMYDMGGKSRTRNWLPKVIFWLINMTMAKAYRINCTMVTERTPDHKCLSMKDAIKEWTFALMQGGAPMQTREASHPQPEINLSRLHSWKSGKKVRSDSMRQAVAEEGHHQESWTVQVCIRHSDSNKTRGTVCVCFWPPVTTGLL